MTPPYVQSAAPAALTAELPLAQPHQETGAGRLGAPVDVVVVGAGLAGLTAARRLEQAGASVVVLEARGRIGGRVHSQLLETGQMIDLGAQFIGDVQPLVSALAKEAGLTRVMSRKAGDVLHLYSPQSKPVRTSPGALPFSVVGKLDALQAIWRIERAVAGFGCANVAELDRVSAADFIRKRTFLKSTYDFVGASLEGELCVPLKEISAYEALDQAESIGGLAKEGESATSYFAGGASGLTNFLAEALGDAVMLNAPVSAIYPEGQSVIISSATGTHRAGHVIVAVPPLLYPSLGLMPLLPENWRKAISSYRPGAVIKTILVFESAWWREAGLSGTVMSPGNPFGAVVDGSPADGSAGILIAFATAVGGRMLGQKTSEQDRIAEALEWIERAHGRKAPPLVAARSVDWSAEPLSLGGYASRRGIGAWATAPELFAPLGRIHFAGTETATKWRSFMEGAIQSGQRAAEAVLAADRES